MAKLRLTAVVLATVFSISTVAVTATDVGEDSIGATVSSSPGKGKGVRGGAQVNAELMRMLREWDLEDAVGALAQHGFKAKKATMMMEEEDINELELSRGDWRALKHLLTSLRVAMGEKADLDGHVLHGVAAGRTGDKGADERMAWRAGPVPTRTMLANEDVVTEPADMSTSSTAVSSRMAAPTTSSTTSSNAEHNTISAPTGGLVDWDNCTWHGFIFDCSTLGEKDPWGNYYTHNPWEACRNIDQDELDWLDQGLHPYGYWVPACDDLYDDPVPSIAQACAATCAEYQYVPLPPISRAPNVSLGVTILDRGWSHQGPGHNAGLHVGRWRVQLLESRTQRSLGRLVVWLEPLGCLQQYPGATCSL